MDTPSIDGILAQFTAALTRPTAASDAPSLITQAAVDLLPGVTSASIWVCRPREPADVVAPTDPLALEGDRLQQQLGEGPVWHTFASGDATSCSDLAADPRWPHYGPKVAASGLAAQLSTPLQTSRKSCAILNLYSTQSGALDGLGLTGQIFGSHAALAWSGAVQLRDLGEALERRQMIGQATGIIMERYGVAEKAAFGFLTRASQTANVKLRDVAAQIVAATAAGGSKSDWLRLRDRRVTTERVPVADSEARLGLARSATLRLPSE